jgi:hypothetical protein
MSSESVGRQTSLREHGFTIEDIKQWRKRQFEAGKPSNLKDFFDTHGLCSVCECTGVRLVGRDDSGEPIWKVCEVCEGTGDFAYPAWPTSIS